MVRSLAVNRWVLCISIALFTTISDAQWSERTKRSLQSTARVCDYALLGAIALLPLCDRFIIEHLPFSVVSDVSNEFTDFVRTECRAAGIANADSLFVKCSPYVNKHLAVSLAHGVVVGQQLYHIWQELHKQDPAPSYCPDNHRVPHTQKGPARIIIDTDMLRFIMRHEASHIKHHDMLTRTVVAVGVGLIGRYLFARMSDKSDACSGSRTQQVMAWLKQQSIVLAGYSGAWFLISRLYVGQEKRCDQEAAATGKVIAQAGMNLFTQAANCEGSIPTNRLAAWLHKYRFEYSNHHPRSSDRANYLRKLAVS